MSLLKTTKSSNLVAKAFKVDDNEIVCDSGGKDNKTFVNSSKNLMYMLNIRATGNLPF